MSFDPAEFLRLAEQLAQDGEDEARLRTAVGRSYYAVFLQARDKLGLRERRRIHGNVIKKLKERDKAAGTQLDKLETLRGEADYEVNVIDPAHRDWRNNWSMAYEYARHIQERLVRLRLR